MSHVDAVAEMKRIGSWAMKGHVPPFPPGEAPDEPHAGDCKLCGEREFHARRQPDELAERRASQKGRVK
jgi:hypothetical protein